MKLQRSETSRNAGSVLLVTLLLSIIMGVTLGGYLIMALTQNRSVVRSQTWNSSIALTEAGVEDGLQEINKYAGTFELLTNWISTASSATGAKSPPMSIMSAGTLVRTTMMFISRTVPTLRR